METLNLPSYNFNIKLEGQRKLIFDSIRKKFVVLTPEEWVRQHCVHYLITQRNYPKSLINVEKELTINGLKKRYDIVVFNPDGSIFLMVECKAPKITINQATFDQIARYNLKINAVYLMVTNGINHYYCQMDFEKEQYTFLQDIPSYNK